VLAFPTVPLDDELLAAFSVGLPVGLTTYLAWARRGWSARTKAFGFVAAAGGALVGAWLGFQVLEGLVAVVTAVAGAVVGANALVLGLDIAWDSYPGTSPDRHQVRERFPLRSDATETART
jgi:hypothetical protein